MFFLNVLKIVKHTQKQRDQYNDPSYIIPSLKFKDYQDFATFASSTSVPHPTPTPFFLAKVKISDMSLHPNFLQIASLKHMKMSYIITVLLSDPTKSAVTPWYHLVPSP